MADEPNQRLEYSPDELEFRADLIRKMEYARNQREANHIEFDGMSYSQWRVSNSKARNAYIPPKTYVEDVRMTSGITREKANTMLAYLLNLNLEPDITAYDKDNNVIEELGTVMEDLIKKSYEYEIPDYDLKRAIIYDEFITQGNAAVEDAWVEYSVPDKELLDEPDMSIADWTEKVDKVNKFCQTNLINGFDIYFGNIKEPCIEMQPYIFTRRVVSRAEAASLLSTWGRWKYVPETIEKVATNDDSQPYHDWSLEPLQNNFTEIIKFYDKWGNNFMMMVNGVMMFKVKRTKGVLSTVPLSSLNGVCEYPVAWAPFEPRPDFIYSTSIPAKTKVDQAAFDEVLKAIVIKFRKSYRPPMANNTGKTLSKKIFDAGTIHDDVDGEKLTEIGTNNGPSSADFNVLQVMKQIFDEKSVSPVFEGQSTKKTQTAREVIELKQQSMMKAGLSILGVVALEKRLKWLRLQSVLTHWTEEQEAAVEGQREAIYKTISVDTIFDEGQQGERLVKFVKGEDEIPTKRVSNAEAYLISKSKKKNVRVNYLSAEGLRNLRHFWKITIIPTEKDSGMLKAAKFEEFVQKAFAMFAPFGKVPNIDWSADKMATLNDVNPAKFWQSAPSPEQQMVGAGVGEQQGPQAANPNTMGAQLTGRSAMSQIQPVPQNQPQ